MKITSVVLGEMQIFFKYVIKWGNKYHIFTCTSLGLLDFKDKNS